MKTSPVAPRDLRRSVLAVPPLARDARLELADAPNRALVRHLEAGGVSSLLYGGNANLYNIDARQYAALLDALPAWAGEDSWVIPSIGPSYGQLLDQAELVRAAGYPTAMALPFTGPATDAGTATGLRRAAERAERPLILYLKWDGYLPVERVAELVADGVVCAIKYAIVRDDPADDDYLRALLDAVDPELVVSGIGERPAVVHLSEFGLRAFTSGSVCVAPRQATDLLRALQEGRIADAETIRARFLPLEDLRDGIHPIRVLHDAVTEAGIADMGPMLPLLSNLEAEQRARVREAARALRSDEPVAPVGP